MRGRIRPGLRGWIIAAAVGNDQEIGDPPKAVSSQRWSPMTRVMFRPWSNDEKMPGALAAWSRETRRSIHPACENGVNMSIAVVAGEIR
jgi:hypothetical protein